MKPHEQNTESAAGLSAGVGPLVMRLRRYNAWRRGAEIEQPEPAQIGADIDAAADLLEAMGAAGISTRTR